ncbi:MAG: hypothetical protein GWN31_03590, partial [Candidatus Thorarchaeota archaeon]|nr:hypothetical protein [Candidatus Thorarchaeota archaeon]NIW13017.1 hypothetical protein [Candidatus Thorarchaeota archaeon]NIW51199.1 hypothetical protein [Candidatus Korarchaeota archaeon]
FTGWTGTHTLNGVFIAKGPNIFHGVKLEKTNILDLTPTILKIYGIPVPEDMDGTPINDIFIDEFKERKIPVQEAKIEQPEEHDEKGLTEDEKSLIEERLRALGYIS